MFKKYKANEPIVWKEELSGWSKLAVLLIILVALAFALDTPKDTQIHEQAPQITSYLTPAPENLNIKPKVTPEEIAELFSKEVKKADFIQKLWSEVENYTQTPKFMVIGEDIIEIKKIAADISSGQYLLASPATDQDTVDLLREMRQTLGRSAAMVEMRIEAAVEISAGSKNPAKSYDKYSGSKRRFHRYMSQYEESYSEYLASNNH